MRDSLPSVKEMLSLEEFATMKSVDTRTVRRWIGNNKLPEGFTLIEKNKKERYVAKVKVEAPVYKHPTKLEAVTVIKINNCLDDAEFCLGNGKPNIKKIAEFVNEHYWTVKRFVENSYKAKDDNRKDKGHSRKFNVATLRFLHERFTFFYLANAQKNASQAIYKVKEETGQDIPERKALQWATALRGNWKKTHQLSQFIKEFVPHFPRDNWGDTPGFMHTVIGDVGKYDDTYIPDSVREEIDKQLDELKLKSINQWKKYRAKAHTASILYFIDQKTAYPLLVMVCAHSVSAEDVKRGMLRLIKEWGLPKKWYLDNGHEFKNDDITNFIYGVYKADSDGCEIDTKLKLIELKDKTFWDDDTQKIEHSKRYAPYGKGRLERKIRLVKDELAAYSESYSPNAIESRKPELELSAVGPSQFFNDLVLTLDKYMYGEHLTKEREMFYHPKYTKAHPINSDRPKSIKEAYERAYAVYERVEANRFLLAYYYADKTKATYREGSVCFTYKSLYKMQYIPEDTELLSQFAYIKKAITVLVDPDDIAKCWFFNGNKLLCEGKDYSFSGEFGISQNRAAQISKVQKAASRSIKRADKMNAIADEMKRKDKGDKYRAKQNVTTSDEIDNVVSELQKIYDESASLSSSSSSSEDGESVTAEEINSDSIISMDDLLEMDLGDDDE